MVQAALDALYLRQVNVIGLVFNAVRPGANGYNYYTYKEYHSPNFRS